MSDRSTRVARWKKAGKIGLAFFLIKGILWLLVPLILAWFVGDGSPN